MSRIVSVWLPHLAIERLKRERAAQGGASISDDRPFALVGSEARGLLLTAVNARCASDGLLPGLSLADARAICPHLSTAPAAPDKDAEALLALARWSSRYSPSLNVDGEDGLWLDITGVAHLFGGEQALLEDLAARLARLGLTTRLGLAETLSGAHALARFAKASSRIVPDDKIASALAPLPVEALRLDPDVVLLLRRLGLKRIGQLYDLPRASLERRFHSREAAEAVLLRLDQALGRRNEKRAPLLPAPDFAARLSFAEPLITHDGVIAGLEHLAGELCRTLARAGEGARRMILWAARSDSSAAAIEAGLSAPSRTPTHLVRLLKDKVETIDMGFGVDLMALAALATEPLRSEQTSLTGTAEKATPEVLIDSLVNRLGTSAVRRLFPRASHIPELAHVSRDAFAGLPAWTDDAATKPPRPLLLLARPEPLQVIAEIPEGPPARFTWRRLRRRVVKAEGPERIAPEWWRVLTGSTYSPLPPCGGASGKHPLRPRDYYRLEDEDGCRYWVFREGLYQDSDGEPPCWFLHGVFA
ncbi:MAG: Y-family DNA polymerase [Methyloceanibacter sp.]|uniref:Y-family DNA polymerase n=1 Tax=Methyloceanibacter sp. TaxID=1965321 RepID=UPI003D6D1607